MKYWIVSNGGAIGPYNSWSQADSVRRNVIGSGIITKEVAKENALGAPDVYPFNTEDYPDDNEG